MTCFCCELLPEEKAALEKVHRAVHGPSRRAVTVEVKRAKDGQVYVFCVRREEYRTVSTLRS